MRRGFMVKGKKAVRAVCACGHVGRSQTPERYQCGHCYCTNVARSNDRTVEELRAKIRKLEAESEELRRRARKFRERHPLP